MALIVSVSFLVFDNELIGLFTEEDSTIDTSLAKSCFIIFFFSNLSDMALNT